MQMSHRVRRGAMWIAVLLVASVGTLSAGALSANATVVPPGSTEIFHTCRSLVSHSNSKYRAVVCADLFSHPDGKGTDYYGQNEIVCLNISSGHQYPCAGVHETPVIATPAGTHGGGQQICGQRFGHSACAATKRSLHVSPRYHSAQSGPYTCSIWAESVRTSIVLPGVPATVSVGVLATPHHTYHCV
jgi:hypothetical protein